MTAGWQVDAHQHFWDVESGEYDWPTPADGVIFRTFGPEDLAPELGPARIDRTVLVQTVDTLADTDSMLATAREHEFIAGVVGWIPLTDVAAAERALDVRADADLRGIRHLIHREPDPDWLVRPEVEDGFRLLAERRLPFDVVAVFPRHLAHVSAVADRHPNLTLIVDHLAKPPYRADGWESWIAQTRAAAERHNVVAKVSGLESAAGQAWTVAELAPAVDIALEAFGPTRLMFGSDWPVCLSVSDYARVARSAGQLLASLTEGERQAIMGATAERVYRLDNAT